MFYIKLIFVALYDVPIIRFDSGIFGNSKKVHLLLYRRYKAFCDVLTLYFIMNLAIKRINCQHWQRKKQVVGHFVTFQACLYCLLWQEIKNKLPALAAKKAIKKTAGKFRRPDQVYFRMSFFQCV